MHNPISIIFTLFHCNNGECEYCCLFIIVPWQIWPLDDWVLPVLLLDGWPGACGRNVHNLGLQIRISLAVLSARGQQGGQLTFLLLWITFINISKRIHHFYHHFTQIHHFYHKFLTNTSNSSENQYFIERIYKKLGQGVPDWFQLTIIKHEILGSSQGNFDYLVSIL